MITHSEQVMTYKDVDTIICEYGIAKAMRLFNDYRIIGMGDEDISDFLASDDNYLERHFKC
jgi:hypothetical protein